MYADYMPCADPTGCGNSISWDYQACTEVVLPDGTDGISPSMFPKLPLTPDMRKTYCEMKYNVTPRTDWLNINMWGDDLGSATNIVFTHGDLDPWRRGGVTNGDVGSVEYYLIKGGAHHLDLRGSHSGDPQSVIDVREKELETIKRWLTDYQRQNIKKRRKKMEPSSYFRAGL
ncbi:dipeptidyl peptidase 2-like [Apostichopus japonicus]|uniref:dipeptidyl peptidase 2-like n=1 Tax=Stichopus japonicus TaxID=307972 RepID=UPI003AB47121